MSNQNLWPNKSKILSLGQDAPSEILREQVRYIKEIDPNLTGSVNEGFVQDEDTSLQWAQFSAIEKVMAFSTASHAFQEKTSPIVICNLVIGMKDKIYSAEILRIRFDPEKYYPMELWDSLNDKPYRISSKEEYLTCLKEIFNSKECLKKLRYILTGNII